MINWGAGQRFSFGNLDAAQQAQYEDNPNLAIQQMLQWYGQGDPNFANTTAGRYIAQRLSGLANGDYMVAAGQNQAQIANEKATWDTQQAQNKSIWDTQQGQARTAWDAQEAQKQQAWHDEYMHWTKEYERGKIGFNGVPNQATMSIAQMNLKRLQANPYTKQAFTPGTYNAGTFTPSTPQLTLTRYLEQNPAATGGLAHDFGMQTAAARGAQPGAFEIRRNLW
jgi:hypothetical protein